MATNLTDYIKVYDDMFEEDFCKSVIKTFNESDVTRIDREQRPTFNEFNISQRFMAQDPAWMSIQKHIQTVFIDIVKVYMNALQCEPDFPAKYSFEEFRIKQYDNNGKDQFRDHVDVGDYNSARRFLVLFLYLNNVEVGGQTNFPRLDYAVSPKRGRILIFPSTWQYRHSGMPPESDKKYIVGTYLHYL